MNEVLNKVVMQDGSVTEHTQGWIRSPGTGEIHTVETHTHSRDMSCTLKPMGMWVTFERVTG
jgi:hypothetical protein